jgi:hypothetical protein
MARDYDKIQTYYEVIINFKHGTKKYHLATKEALDKFMEQSKQNDTILSTVIHRVEKSIYLYYGA